MRYLHTPNKTNRYKIIFAGVSALPDRKQETRLTHSLNRELAEIQGKYRLYLQLFSRSFPIDQDGWKKLITKLPESSKQLLGRENCDLLIWGRADPSGKTFTLHFSSQAEPHWQQDPASSALTILEDLPLPLNPQLIPFITAAILANLFPSAASRDATLQPPLDIARRKMSLRLKEQLAQASPERAFTLRSLYAWTCLQTQKHLEAAEIFEDLLSAWPQNRTRTDYAQISANLASTRLAIGLAENSAEDLEQALEATTRALSVSSRQSAPLRWAGLQMLQANIHRALGKQYADPVHLHEAMTALKAAAMTWRHNELPAKWGIAQTELGNVLHQLGQHDAGTDRLQQAASTFRSVFENMEALTPRLIAQTKHALAVTLLTIAQRHYGSVSASEAVTALRQALAAATKPLKDKARLSLAKGLILLGRIEHNAALFEEAVTITRLTPLGDEHNATLGQALRALGKMRHDETLLREAAALLKDSTENATDLATTLLALSEQSSGTQDLQDAIAAFDKALQATNRETAPRDWALLQRDIALASLALAKRHDANAQEKFEEAITAFRQSLTALKRDHAPLLWARIQNEMGEALSLYATSGGGVPKLEQAAQAFTKALETWSVATAPHERAMTLNNLGNTLADLGSKQNNRDQLQSAKRAYAEAFDIYSANSVTDLANLASKNLARAETSLMAMHQSL